MRFSLNCAEFPAVLSPMPDAARPANSCPFRPLACVLLLAAAQFPAHAESETPIHALSPEEELATFEVPPGYRMELVLSERDDVKEPVNVTFDGNGRMYVAEMRSYMQDLAGSHERDQNGRVSRHESTRGDGHFDRHTVFADKLVAPRMVLPLDDRVLINETDSLDLQAYRDSTGTGVADQRKKVFSGGGRSGNIETQQSGLIWALDNWCYSTTTPSRLRLSTAKTTDSFGWLKNWFRRAPMAGLEVRTEPTLSNGGQWGLAQDNYGKLWWSNGGAEIPFLHFQVPILYGAFDLPGQVPPEFNTVWPRVGLADVQGGPLRFRPEDRTLNNFTAACGQEIVRVDRLPEDLRGDALVCEPVGRLIRRAKVELREGMTILRNPYEPEHGEFIRSTDPCFRPVNVANGPDGCLYIVDMYRGVIQEAQWLRPGDYLYSVVRRYGMDQVVGHGRIWRLAHRDFQPAPQPRMLEETPAQLVTHLAHPNGWWRDTAQKLLVLRGDKSVVPALKEMAVSHAQTLARIHALWTLEGLDALDAATVRRAFRDPDPQVRIAALRASESLFKKNDRSLRPEVEALAHDPEPQVVLQTVLTAKLLKWNENPTWLSTALAATPLKGVRDLGMMAINVPDALADSGMGHEETYLIQRGGEIYRELCFACHGVDGQGMPMIGTTRTLAPPLAGAPDVLNAADLVPLVLLRGLTGPVNGRSYDAQMVPMGSNSDLWIAQVTSFVRNSFGNHGAIVWPGEVARLRATTKHHPQPFDQAELQQYLPRTLGHRERWKASASKNGEAAALAIDGDPATAWNSSAAPKEGDWFQIELPEPALISGLRLENRRAPDDYPPGFDVTLSLDGLQWTASVAKGHGTIGIAEIEFPKASARFVRVTLNRTRPKVPWVIDELQILLPLPESAGQS